MLFISSCRNTKDEISITKGSVDFELNSGTGSFSFQSFNKTKDLPMSLLSFPLLLGTVDEVLTKTDGLKLD